MGIRQEANGAPSRHVGSREVEHLVDELFVDDELRRETAIVRLRVIGARAFGCLSAVVGGTAPAHARIAALRALEGGPSPRIVDLALSTLATAEPIVAEAAVRLLAPWVDRERGTRVLDRLLGLVMDPDSNRQVAAAARDALATLPPDLVQPILSAPDPLEANESTDPSTLLAWVAGPGRDASAAELGQLVAQVVKRERLTTSGDERQRWVAARGRMHAQLARMGSRAALGDLRETFERATRPLPLDFLVAVASIGDAACLDALARAWSAAPAEPWWRTRLSDAGRVVMQRLGLTGRHAAVRKIRVRTPGFV